MGVSPANKRQYSEFSYETISGVEYVHLKKIKTNPNLPNTYSPPEDFNTMLKVLQKLVKENPNGQYLGTRKKIAENVYEGYSWRSYEEIYNLSILLSKGMADLNLGAWQKYKGQDLTVYGIYSKNREEWMISDIAGWQNSWTSVPLYETLSEESIKWTVDQTDMKSTFISAPCLPKLIAMKQKGMMPTLTNAISFDEPIDADTIKKATDVGLKVIYFWSDVIEAGKKSSKVLTPCTPDNLITICYTSGTTARGKGVELTHRAYHAQAYQLYIGEYANHGFRKGAATLSYLTFAHVYDRFIHYWGLCHGMKFGFFRGDVTKLLDDAVDLKPEAFIVVPRILMRVYEKALGEIDRASPMKKKLLQRAIAYKVDLVKKTGICRHDFYDKWILNGFANWFGGRLQVIFTGGAPIDAMVMHKVRAIFGVDMVQAWGQTETCGAIACSYYHDVDDFSVGAPMTYTEVKLISVPDLGYNIHDQTNGVPTPRGEIWMRGPQLMSGYFKDPEKTKETIDGNGWLHTGDVAMFLPAGVVRIVDRVKNLLKLSQGAYIAPEHVESVLIHSKFVAQVFVHGDSFQSFLVGIVVPRKDSVMEWGKNAGLKDDFEALCKNQKLVNEVLSEFTRLSKAAELSSIEQVKKLILTPVPFSVENDTLTPSFKLKRNQAKKLYEAAIKEMYATGLGRDKEIQFKKNSKKERVIQNV